MIKQLLTSRNCIITSNRQSGNPNFGEVVGCTCSIRSIPNSIELPRRVCPLSRHMTAHRARSPLPRNTLHEHRHSPRPSSHMTLCTSVPYCKSHCHRARVFLHCAFPCRLVILVCWSKMHYPQAVWPNVFYK